jgi:hypothetical protein
MFPVGAQIWHTDYYFADWFPIYMWPSYQIGGKKPRKLLNFDQGRGRQLSVIAIA